MASLKKGNRVINVEDNRVEGYLQRGYDQIGKNGQVTKRATGGKTVSISEFNKLQEKYDKLKEQGGDDQAWQELNEKYQALRDEYEELKEKAEKFSEKGKALQKENEDLKKQMNTGAKENKK